MILNKVAEFWQYLFCFVLFNLIIFAGYKNIFGKSKNKTLPILLIMIFLLFPFWAGDYFGTEWSFHYAMDADFRDPLYYYIRQISFGNYTIFRLYVWGGAFAMTAILFKRFNLSRKELSFFFPVTFLLLFSYARASLGMASYFLGLSFFIIPMQQKKKLGYLLGLVLVIGSYYGHRSLLPLIALAPLSRFALNTKKTVLLWALLPIAIGYTANIMGAFLNEEIAMDESLEGFSEAATRYSQISNREFSMRSQVLKWVQYAGFYWCYYCITRKISKLDVNEHITYSLKHFHTIVTLILIMATAFTFSSANGATDALGYRYLYMAGIPLSLFTAVCYNFNLCSKKEILKMILFFFISQELTLLGTLKLL